MLPALNSARNCSPLSLLLSVCDAVMVMPPEFSGMYC